jgi:hypothetical protein
VVVVSFQCLVLVSCATATAPPAADDELVKIERTPLDSAYRAPGFDLEDYQRLAVDECTVSFRDNWLRDQNRERGPSQLVTTDDMRRIERQLAASCRDIFSDRLQLRVEGEESAPRGDRTLTVRPAIVDLDILAPDIQASGRQTQLASNAVRMGLEAELVDSDSGATAVRIVDHRRADEVGRTRPTSSVGNMADAERIVRYWVAQVHEVLTREAD